MLTRKGFGKIFTVSLEGVGRVSQGAVASFVSVGMVVSGCTVGDGGGVDSAGPGSGGSVEAR